MKRRRGTFLRARALPSNATLAVLAGALVLILLSAWAASSARVVGRDVLPHTTRQVERIQVYGAIEFYTGSELRRPSTDVLNALLLGSIASAALLSGLVVRRRADARHLFRFFALAAAGCVLLVADELFGLHETLGHNMVLLRAVPGVERPDDLIFALYLVPAMAFLVFFRDILAGSRRGLVLFGAAVGFSVAAVVADVVSISPLEEILELVASGCLLGGFVALSVDHLHAQPPGPHGSWSGAGTSTVSARP